MVFLVLDVASLLYLQIIWGARASFVCLLTSNLKYLLATGCISNFLWIIVVVFCYFFNLRISYLSTLYLYHFHSSCSSPTPPVLHQPPAPKFMTSSHIHIHIWIYIWIYNTSYMYVCHLLSPVSIAPMYMYLGLTPGVGKGLKWFSLLQQLLTTCRPSSRAGALWSSSHPCWHVVCQVLCR